jgi:hypothetical protein
VDRVTCRHRSSEVLDTDVDADGYRVRLRRCKDCGARWSTEERHIGDHHAFYGRCERRLDDAFTRRHRATRRCRYCGARYHGGGFSTHVRKASHRAVLSERERTVTHSQAKEKAARQRARYWRERYGMDPPPTPVYLRLGDGVTRYTKASA